ncbi:MAG TPA: helix-turn-helix domain-containing protein [Rhodopila sp.]|nr:helix-turn-helix domain-containing protein [Rhodopila sp.]
MLKQLLTATPVTLDALNRPCPQTHRPEDAAAAPAQPVADPPAPPVLLTLQEVAQRLNISEKSVQRRIKAGLIRKTPLGGRLVRVAAAELQRLTAGGLDLPPAEGLDQ